MEFSYQPFTGEYIQQLTGGDVRTAQHFTVYFGKLLCVRLGRCLRSPQAIEDVRQETLLRVFQILQRKGNLDNPERLGVFVMRVCKNVLSEHYRDGSRYAALPEHRPDPPQPGPDPERALLGAEEKQRVLDAMEALPAKDREILRLIFFEERDKEEVCRQWSIERDYLRVLLHRAKNRFRKALCRPRGEEDSGEITSPPLYSSRSATRGSTCVARSAGT